MTFSVKELVEKHQGRNLDLFAQTVNPQFVRVLRTIGFDKSYQKAEGCTLFDEKGESYLDFLAGYGAYNIGRSHPTIKAVIKEALDLNLPSMVQMDAPLLAGLLAEKLLSLIPHLDKVFFTNSGTEANEGAIKFARAATGRERILHLDHSFHGLTLGSLSAMGNPEFRDGFGELLPATAIPRNDLVRLEKELSRKDVAAFLVEAVQGKGVHLPDDHFLPEAQKLCRQHGTLLILDEVQTGLGRTGRWFAFQHWGLEPDIVTVAKSLSGGFIPVGAILYRDAVYRKIFSRMDRCVVHSNTFGKNSLAMVVGLATLQVIEEEKLVENAEKQGAHLLSSLQKAIGGYEMVQEVRGKGLMMAIEFGPPRSLKLKVGWKMIHAANKGLFGQMIVVPLMSKHRILTQVAGHNVDIVKLLPPLIIGEKEVRRFVQAFEEVVADCHKFPGAAWEVGMTLAKQALKNRSPSTSVTQEAGLEETNLPSS
ncbi:MAG: aspartate aminotransferase family protein [Deltaproteobacteria bacterium]|nr:aspartate aminotransferase family protein [Deltaproteobacteria bacterium]